MNQHLQRFHRRRLVGLALSVPSYVALVTMHGPPVWVMLLCLISTNIYTFNVGAEDGYLKAVVDSIEARMRFIGRPSTEDDGPPRWDP